ncbi:hypothetical protein ACFX2I_011668 [Malus domestica]
MFGLKKSHLKAAKHITLNSVHLASSDLNAFEDAPVGQNTGTDPFDGQRGQEKFSSYAYKTGSVDLSINTNDNTPMITRHLQPRHLKPVSSLRNELGLFLDVSRVGFTDEFVSKMKPWFQAGRREGRRKEHIKVMDIASLAKILQEHIKVGGKAGALDDSVTVSREKNRITITSDSNFSKR